MKKCFLSCNWLNNYQKKFLETLLVLQVTIVTVTRNHKVFQQNLLLAMHPAMHLSKIYFLACYLKINASLLGKNTSLKILSCFLFFLII